MVRAVKPGKKSGVAAFFGCNPRHESVAQSEAPIDVFSLAPGAGSSADTGTRGHAASTSGSVVTVNHRLAEKDGVNLLPTEVTNHSAAAGHVTTIVISDWLLCSGGEEDLRHCRHSRHQGEQRQGEEDSG